MKAIALDRYESLRAGAQVIERDGHGDKVLCLTDGRFLKLFRRKRLLSSALWNPYAQRFADNTRELHARGIPCPVVDEVGHIAAIKRDVVIYQPLAGDTLRQLIVANTAPTDLGPQLAAFVERLYAQGIYFRSLHLGNIVFTPEGTLGLIDVADLRAFKRPLSARLQLRNQQHMQRYDVDKAWLRRVGLLGGDASE
jgi:hypothetical protein